MAIPLQALSGQPDAYRRNLTNCGANVCFRAGGNISAGESNR
jgi:hypothetical protein